jgi:hypothetical protein
MRSLMRANSFRLLNSFRFVLYHLVRRFLFLPDLVSLHPKRPAAHHRHHSNHRQSDWSWAVGDRLGYVALPGLLTYVNGGWTEANFTQTNFLDAATGFTTGLSLQSQRCDRPGVLQHVGRSGRLLCFSFSQTAWVTLDR